ncbi:response regulator transcription factor [Aliarcobacter skirrowii]|uniref:response regulator transcription factor n=1 Tax=Aliarcobacter skirrowii TaxID=28200 RepID=UPI0008349EDE|nr:hypothetical protein [Aliarcobacter skirrowii]
MKEIKLLIVDDDINAIKSIKSTIRSYERQGSNLVTYKIYKAQSLVNAVKKIKYYKIDTAIVDLNLNPNDFDNTDGNDVIHEFINQSRIPIFVVSGTPEKLAPKLVDNNLIKVFTRNHDVNEKIIEKEIPKLLLSKTIDYFSKDGYLEKEINDFYWNHLQSTLNDWDIVAESNSSDIDKILSRHTVACLNEKLYVNGNIGSFDKYHPGEMYIIPPIKKHYHTGDIISKNNELFIILNPACDIVNQGNLEFYLVAKLIEIQTLQDIQQNIKTDKPYNSLVDSLNKTGKEKFKKYSNNQSQRYHYIPQFDKISKDYLIDFQNLQNIKIGNILEEEDYLTNRESIIKEYIRIASISSPFLKDIISRFSLYYARQGQPNLL